MVHDKTDRQLITGQAFANWLFAQECTFARGVQSLLDLPDLTLPEVAFVGRSNVGKSSLVNALLNRKALARVSHTPGRTQQLNYFLLAGRLYLVDMPGYGYARVSKETVAAWTDVIRTYLRGRATLKRVYLLIDARHGLKSVDKEMMTLMDTCATSYQLVLTKVDKISMTELDNLSGQIQQSLINHAAAYPILHATSSFTKIGIEDLRLSIAEWAHDSSKEPHDTPSENT